VMIVSGVCSMAFDQVGIEIKFGMVEPGQFDHSD
jgi:hypothetical protein